MRAHLWFLLAAALCAWSTGNAVDTGRGWDAGFAVFFALMAAGFLVRNEEKR